ncbi:MAG: alpha/beta hydrolase [Thermoproteota archaeon]|nr:alpha/beta hydrolase [Thermoproteota archaeon]
MDYFNREKFHFSYKSSHSTISVVLIFSTTLLLSPSSYLLLKIDNAWATTSSEPTIPVYMVTTRGGFDSPQGVPETGYDGNPLGDINQLRRDCPPEVAIFVHGWFVSSDAAKEQLDRVRMSLENNTYYNIHLVGYSWGSDIEWNEAKILAKNEGTKLAQFISELEQECNGNIDIRLIAHSLGSRVALSSLNALNSILPSSIAHFKILSVHLMGAAVDNDEISLSPIASVSNPNPWWGVPQCTTDTSGLRFAYGQDIQQRVVNFYNLVNPGDNVLQWIYPCYQGGNRALGESGKQDSSLEVQSLDNYTDVYGVQEEIKPYDDADAIYGCDIGICDLGLEPPQEGDNHLGYMGFRDSANTSKLVDDGAINIVVDAWRNG